MFSRPCYQSYFFIFRSRWEMEQRGSSEGFANSESQVQVCSQHFNFTHLDFNKAFHQISNLITQDFCSISNRRSQSKLTLVTFRKLG